jgi:predicted RNase H-like HicB family nuclease
MTYAFTAVYQKAEEGGYIGFVEELPGAITQGETLDETRENLQEAIALVLEGNRILAEEALSQALTALTRVALLRLAIQQTSLLPRVPRL